MFNHCLMKVRYFLLVIYMHYFFSVHIVFFLKLTSQALNISTMDISDISFDNINVNTFIYNYLNIVFGKLNERNLDIKTEVINLINEVNTNLIVLFILMFFISFISLFIFAFLIMTIKTERDAILFLFLDVNQIYVQVLYRKCENFLSNYVV